MCEIITGQGLGEKKGMTKKRPLDTVESEERASTLLRSAKVEELRKRLGTHITPPLNANIPIRQPSYLQNRIWSACLKKVEKQAKKEAPINAASMDPDIIDKVESEELMNAIQELQTGVFTLDHNIATQLAYQVTLSDILGAKRDESRRKPSNAEQLRRTIG